MQHMSGHTLAMGEVKSMDFHVLTLTLEVRFINSKNENDRTKKFSTLQENIKSCFYRLHWLHGNTI